MKLKTNFEENHNKTNEYTLKKKIIIMTAMIISAIIIVVVSFAIYSSFDKISNVSIENIESGIKEFDEEGILKVNSCEEGYILEYECSIFYGEFILTASADENRNVSEIIVVGKDVDTDYFNSISMTDFFEAFNSLDDLTYRELATQSLLFYFSSIGKYCYEMNTSDEAFASIESILDARDSTQINNNWVFMVESGIDTITITLSYNEHV